MKESNLDTISATLAASVSERWVEFSRVEGIMDVSLLHGRTLGLKEELLAMAAGQPEECRLDG